MREQDLQAAIVQAAGLSGWLTYHTYDSRRSVPGFPDLVLVHPGRTIILFAELKSEKGKLTADQILWLTSLARATPDVYVWRPEHYDAALAWIVDGQRSALLEASRVPAVLS